MLRRLEEVQQAAYQNPYPPSARALLVPPVDLSLDPAPPPPPPPMPPPPGRGPPEFVLTPGATSEVYGSMDRGSNAGPDDVNPEGLWEENPAILAPATLLAAQLIELLLQRRDQALDGLRGLLHSLSRVKNASNKLPTYVAKAYQARLQHAIGWYRVTTCEVKRNRAQRQALATALPSSLLPSPDAFLTPDPHMLAPPLGSLAQLVERITFARRGKTPPSRRLPAASGVTCMSPTWSTASTFSY